MVMVYAGAMVRRWDPIHCGALVRFFVASLSLLDPGTECRVRDRRSPVARRSHPAVEAARAVIALLPFRAFLGHIIEGLPSSRHTCTRTRRPTAVPPVIRAMWPSDHALRIVVRRRLQTGHNCRRATTSNPAKACSGSTASPKPARTYSIGN